MARDIENSTLQSETSDMDELVNWLRAQKGSVLIYGLFQQKAKALAARDKEHAALLRLLSEIVENFSEECFGEPVPSDVNEQAYSMLVGFVGRAAALDPARPRDHLDLLNDIGRADLGIDLKGRPT